MHACMHACMHVELMKPCVTYTWHPNLRKTPSGGRMMARRISMQLAVPSSAIYHVCRPSSDVLVKQQERDARGVCGSPRKEGNGYKGWISSGCGRVWLYERHVSCSGFHRLISLLFPHLYLLRCLVRLFSSLYRRQTKADRVHISDSLIPRRTAGFPTCHAEACDAADPPPT